MLIFCPKFLRHKVRSYVTERIWGGFEDSAKVGVFLGKFKGIAEGEFDHWLYAALRCTSFLLAEIRYPVIVS